MLQGGPAVDTIIYDVVLEAAMRAQNFNSKMLHISGPWKWLLDEFSNYYGVSDAYRKLRCSYCSVTYSHSMMIVEYCRTFYYCLLPFLQILVLHYECRNTN
jgi:hypothetical protein